MNLLNRPLFKALSRRRAFIGLISTLINISIFYFILCVTHTPDLSSSWGIHFGFDWWTGQGWWKVLLVGLFVTSSTINRSKDVSKKDKTRKIYPKNKDNDQKDQKQIDLNPVEGLAVITEEEIVNMTLELSKSMRAHVSAIFIGEHPIPNAFTTFGADKGGIVYLNSNLLEIMDREAIRAVIAHEIGHIKSNDTWYKLWNEIPIQMSRLWILLIFIQVLGVMLLSTSEDIFFYRMLVGAGIFLVFSILTTISSKYANKTSRLKEKLADAYAVEFTSIEGMMNSLLRLNERSHTIESLLREMRQHGESLDSSVIHEALSSFPRGPKSHQFIQEHAERYFVAAQIKVALANLKANLPDESKMRLVEEILVVKAAEAQKQKEQTQNQDIDTDKGQATSPVKAQPVPFIWQEFDWNRDGDLQLNELAALIEALRARPSALAGDDEGTHPPIRERLLWIAALCEPELQAVKLNTPRPSAP